MPLGMGMVAVTVSVFPLSWMFEGAMVVQVPSSVSEYSMFEMKPAVPAALTRVKVTIRFVLAFSATGSHVCVPLEGLAPRTYSVIFATPSLSKSPSAAAVATFGLSSKFAAHTA